MQLFYAPDITPPLYTLSEEGVETLRAVLRLGRGDTLHITDGRGNLFCCEIHRRQSETLRRCASRTTQRAWEALPYFG